MLKIAIVMGAQVQRTNQSNSMKEILHSLDFVLCDNCSPLIVQHLQLIPAELSLVTIASNSSFMAGEQTCETFLSSKWNGCIFTVGGNSCTQRHVHYCLDVLDLSSIYHHTTFKITQCTKKTFIQSRFVKVICKRKQNFDVTQSHKK